MCGQAQMSGLIVPVACALLETQQVGQCGCIRRNFERPGFPLSARNPRERDIEAMQVVRRAQLGRGHFEFHDVEVRGQLQRECRGQLEVA